MLRITNMSDMLCRLRRMLQKGIYVITTRLIITPLLICLVFFLFELPVFSQIFSDESLAIIKDQNNPPGKETGEESDDFQKPDIQYKSTKSRDPFESQLFTIDKEAIKKKKEEAKAEQMIESVGPKISETFALSIQGIIWNSEKPLVIINNQVLKKGDPLLIAKEGNVIERITITDIEKISQLTKLRLSDEEKEIFRGHLQQMIEYVEKLNELDTDDVEPTYFMEHSTNVLREDHLGESLNRNDALKNASSKKEGFFRVPKVISQGDEPDQQIEKE